MSAVLYALEHPPPVALLPYHLAVRRGVRQHDGENLWFATEKFTAIEAVVRQRKNYKFALLFKVHCYEAWRASASTLPLAKFIDHNTVALNESFGEGGVNSVLRVPDFSHDESVARLEIAAVAVAACNGGAAPPAWVLWRHPAAQTCAP